MEKKSFQHIPAAVREAYSRAQKARGGDQVSIDLLKEVVKKEPAFVQAREKLRGFEKRKAAAANPVGKIFASLGAMFSVMSAKGQAEKDPLAAMAKCEDVLAKNLDNPMALQVLADAALNAGAPFIAVEALSIVREFHPKNEGNLRKLASALQQNNQAREAVHIFQEIAARYPNDIAIQGEVRAALALASMEKGNWEEEGSAQEKAADASSNVIQQLLDGTIHDAVQAKQVVDHLNSELEKGDSVDIHRKLAEAYMVMHDYDNAIGEYEKVAASLGALDPFVDKQIEEAVVGRFNSAIDELTRNPESYENPAEQIAAFTAQRHEYSLARARERVRIYPNDTQLNYDLGIRLYEDGSVNDAIACFQIAGKSPQRRSDCLGYLGRCFAANGQYDMAIEQFKAALNELDPGDKRRFDVMYDLASVQERNGHEDQAIETFKDIYQKQANFRDVATKIQEYYNRQKQG